MPNNSGITAPRRHPRALPLPSKLRHTYIIMRHGFSIPNGEKKIVSTMENGCLPSHGLTELGRRQAREASMSLAKVLESQLASSSRSQAKDIVIISSPFSRALETATIVAQELGAHTMLSSSLRTPRPIVSDALRERSFGQFELQPDANYDLVWAKDARNGDASEAYGTESTLSVWLRVRDLILKLEEQLRKPSVVLLVSHGDTLQITHTGADASLALCSHRERDLLRQAEWRILGPSSLTSSKL